MAEIIDFLDKFHIEDLKNPKHPAIFTSHPDYDLFIFRLPLLKGDELEVESFGFIVTAEESFYYDKKSDLFQPLKDKYFGLHVRLDGLVDKLLANIDQCDEAVGGMEDDLYDNATGSDYIERWFDLKKNISRMERILFKSLGALKEKVSNYRRDEVFPESSFHDLLEHLDRSHRYSAMMMTKLDNIYNFYNTRMNEKINTTVYLLTVISAIFLPLNLIVGFFGMNTSGLPFTGGDEGTKLVIYVLLLLSAVMLAYLGLRSHALKLIIRKIRSRPQE